MINITRNQQRFHAQIIRKQDRNELVFFRAVKPILNRQWTNVIKSVENGVTAISSIVNNYQREMLNTFRQQYRIIGEQWFDETVGYINSEKSYISYYYKDIGGIFEQTFNLWLEREALKKVVTIINPNTIKSLKAIIAKGIEDGKSYGQIASDMRKIEPTVNRHRSKVIASTEVHTVYSTAVDDTISVSGLQTKEKEWLAFLDERTRSPHADVGGTRIPVDEFFQVGTDRMLYPGDSAHGGPDNLILCRCIALYFT